MANGKIRFGKQSGGTLGLVFPDGVSNTEVTFPESGELATKDYADLKQSKSELAYNVDASSYIPNTLASSAIIERGSNANGEYVKYADGTLICMSIFSTTGQSISNPYANLFTGFRGWVFPSVFIAQPVCQAGVAYSGQAAWSTISGVSNTQLGIFLLDIGNRPAGTEILFSFFAIGRWK